MTIDQNQVQHAQDFIRLNVAHIADGANEDVVRSEFASRLRLMFPDNPSWLNHHIRGGESSVSVGVGGQRRTRFIDNLVNLTTIEYESNIQITSKRDHGLWQVREQCAGLLNQGERSDLILGILSDTIRWNAYRVASVSSAAPGLIEASDVQLELIESIDVGQGDAHAARQLLEFLEQYLGRVESRPLTAESLKFDLGFDSQFCTTHLVTLRSQVNRVWEENPQYAQIVENLWKQFVDVAEHDAFNLEEYVDELYLVTLAKLVCANVIERQALLSTDDHLRAIMDGDFFGSKGLVNLVEYDFFGWLNTKPHVDLLLPVAKGLQEDLRAYDFSSIPSEDLFGQLMAQLARKSRRLLLGQEWTPRWLAEKIVGQAVTLLPDGETPRFVDMCCGSGAFIVETVHQTKAISGHLPAHERIKILADSITGFDIDPLAVMLSKINWVLAARDWLEPFGSFEITIPVYHADSLFASTPLAGGRSTQGDGKYELHLADKTLRLPDFLITSAMRSTFNSLLDTAHRMMESASRVDKLTLEPDAVSFAADQALQLSTLSVTPEQRKSAEGFLGDLTTVIDQLDREGRNGIWTFVLRNSYRPALVEGQFNGLVSNPPWLALSKIANNPYQSQVRLKAVELNIQPTGAAFLHIELATIFLLHSLSRFISADGVVGCVLPETVLSGAHHEPFRSGEYARGPHPIPFAIRGIWEVDPGTFNNNAIVLFGTKVHSQPDSTEPILGAVVARDTHEEVMFYRHVRGNRSAWTTRQIDSGSTAFFEPAAFRQGADIMPRTAFFHQLTSLPSAGNQRWQASPIAADSYIAYATGDAKALKDFKITPRVVSDEVVFDVLTSSHLTPFTLTEPLKALLPITRDSAGRWARLSPQRLTAMGAGTEGVFREIGQALGTGPASDVIWNRIDVRGKLRQQSIPTEGFLVVTGAGGSNVCAAYRDLSSMDAHRLIVDQTLYWAHVESEEEAMYLTGLFNSAAIGKLITDFQARGLFGARHIHKLPFEQTPKYDASLVAHQGVVDTTRSLLGDFAEILAKDTTLQRLIDPNRGPLHFRRPGITRALRSLDSYAKYRVACHALYNVEDELDSTTDRIGANRV